MRHSRRQRREDGQALVEFALTLSMFALFVMVVIQLGLLFIAYYSETRMARESARWLAVNSRTTDDLPMAQHVQSTMLPGLVAGAPVAVASPSCTTSPCSEYTVGAMDVQFTPCTYNGTVCTAGQRAPGTTLYVQLQYRVAAAGLIFLPSSFRIGQLVVPIPNSLPAYKVSVMVE